MRPWKLYWKDVRITIRWLWHEIKQDFKSMFTSASDSETYLNVIMEYYKAFKHILTSKTHRVYFAILFFIFSMVYGNIFLKIFFGLLIFVTYFQRLWGSGEPLKDYKSKYY